MKPTDTSAEFPGTFCSLSDICGGCCYCTVTYEEELRWKLSRVRSLMGPFIAPEDIAITQSPLIYGYRNKMEYSFGDARKDGSLTLGLHKKRSFHDVLDTYDCKLVHEDFNTIVRLSGDFFRSLGLTFKDKRTHRGYLRHLLVRRSFGTGEILIDIVTTSQPPLTVLRHSDINFPQTDSSAKLDERKMLETYKDLLLDAKLTGSIRGILHTVNDSLSDVICDDHTDIIYGEDHITEKILGLSFDISPFSFFQTNTPAAEVLYKIVREFAQSLLRTDMTVYDLYSGTGTISQLIAPLAGKVVGVEIVEEAAEKARVNALKNGLSSCSFIAGDVLKVLDTLPPPDLIILDPPREGVHAKALRKIIDYGADHIIYVSCRPESLARDLEAFVYAGYLPIRARAVDQFPRTNHVETVVLLSRANVDLS